MSSSIQTAPLGGLYLPEKTIGTHIAVFGDVHARLGLLDGVIDYYSHSDVQFVNNGDAINKGAQSKEVIQRLLDIGAICLMGNHEWLVLRAMKEKDEKEQGRFVSENFSRYFAPICASYDVCAEGTETVGRKKAVKLIGDLSEAIKAEGHDEYFNNLKLYLDTGKLLVVHAGVKVDKKWDGEDGQKMYLDRVALSIEEQDCDWHGIPDQVMDGKDFPLAKKLIVPKGLDRVVVTGHHHNDDRKKARITHGGRRVRLGGPKGDKGPLYVYDNILMQVVEITAKAV